MPNVFITSDTHFGHAGVCRFLRDDGTKLRPWDNPAEMDEALVANWNSVVGPKDKVYHLGDVVINRKALKTLSRLNGEKVLIKGNHDIFRLEEYTPYFKDVRAYHVLNGMIFSHIPVHESALYRFGTNIHGHLHSNRVTKKELKQVWEIQDEQPYYEEVSVVDNRYFCVCVEQTNFTPISLEELKVKIVSEGGTVGFKR
jgi:calcineurin-like phosphoesterase family protein